MISESFGRFDRGDSRSAFGCAASASISFARRRHSATGHTIGHIFRAYAVAPLGCADGLPVVDETGIMKGPSLGRGCASIHGLRRQGVENTQLGVFMAYAACLGRDPDRGLLCRDVHLGDGAG